MCNICEIHGYMAEKKVNLSHHYDWGGGTFKAKTRGKEMVK